MEKKNKIAIVLLLIGLATLVMLVGIAFLILAYVVAVFGKKSPEEYKGLTFQQSTADKIPVTIGALFAVLLFPLSLFVYEVFSWWYVEAELLYVSDVGYMTSLGPLHEGGTTQEFLLCTFLFYSGAFLLLFAPLTRSRALSLLSSSLMLAGALYFLVALQSYQTFNFMVDGLNFLLNEDYSIYKGSVDLGIGSFSWGLHTGYYIALGSVAFAFLGSFVMKPNQLKKARKQAAKQQNYLISQDIQGVSSIPSGSSANNGSGSSSPSQSEYQFYTDEEMVYCRHCGAKIKGDSMFCSKCGQLQ